MYIADQGYNAINIMNLTSSNTKIFKTLDFTPNSLAIDYSEENLFLTVAHEIYRFSLTTLKLKLIAGSKYCKYFK